MEEEQARALSNGKDGCLSHGCLLGWGSGEFAQHGQDRFQSYTWGNSNSGQLGCGDKVTHSLPQKVAIPSINSPLVGVACGGRHTIWWTENGRCFSSGNNFYAQLGYNFRLPNYKENQVRPHILRPLLHHKVVQVACGEKHSLFLFETGLVAGCGCNDSGQLGSGTREEVVSPKIIEDLDERSVTVIACGQSHSLAVTVAGELYVWGCGRACGNRRLDVLLPMQRRTKHCNIVSVAGGSSHSMALSASGSVYTWGGGIDGQLGFGETSTYLEEPRCLTKSTFKGCISQIACRESYSAAVTASGQLYMWGKNNHVISCSSKGFSHFHPMPIECHRPISKLACGAWHAAAITGYPAWQPLVDDSSDDDIFETNQDHDYEQHIDDQLQELESRSDSDKLLPEHMKNPRSKKSGLASKPLSLSLAEFYAPTPLPAIRPISQLTERRLSVQSCESAIIIDEGNVKQMSEQPHQGENVAHHFESQSNVEISEVQYTSISYNLEKEKLNTVEIESKTVKGEKEAIVKDKHSVRDSNSKRDMSLKVEKASSAKNLGKDVSSCSSLVRAKSFPVFQTQGRSKTSRLISKDKSGKFDKRKSVHPIQQQRQKLSLNNTDLVMDYRVAHRGDGMPIPKMTRAHTYYGQMCSKPTVTKPSTYTLSTSLYSDDRSRTFLHRVVRRNTKLQFSAKVDANVTPGGDGKRSAIALPPPQCRAVYSSASSWRSREQKGNDILIMKQRRKEDG